METRSVMKKMNEMQKEIDKYQQAWTCADEQDECWLQELEQWEFNDEQISRQVEMEMQQLEKETKDQLIATVVLDGRQQNHGESECVTGAGTASVTVSATRVEEGTTTTNVAHTSPRQTTTVGMVRAGTARAIGTFSPVVTKSDGNGGGWDSARNRYVYVHQQQQQ